MHYFLHIFSASLTEGGRFRMCSAFALHIFSGKNILNFAFVALCGALQTHFHGRGRSGKRHLQRRFLRKRGAAGGRSLPHGGAVAQRLRGYKWRSEKSVKAIAPTGAALAFLCFDFFFRIVKGEQPLARCGVGGVQRQGGGSRNTPPCLWPSGASLPACTKQKLSPRSVHFSGSLLARKRERTRR